MVSHTPPLRTRPLALLDVLAGDAEYIRIEVPGDAGRGAEFVLMRDGVREWHQAKRQRTEGPWTITSLNSTGVLAPWWSKLQVGDRCVFVSGTSAQQLYELAERATMAESWTEFDQEFLGARDQRANFELLSKAWGVAPGEAVFLALRKVSAYAIDEKQLKERVRDRAAVLLNGDPAAVARHLAEIADDSVHRRVTAPDILESLAGSGYARIRADVGQGRERDAPGTRQAIRNSAGANVYVSGYRHKVSVHTGPRWPLGGRPRLLAGLLVVFIAAVTAVYLVSRSSGIPEYFNTGRVILGSEMLCEIYGFPQCAAMKGWPVHERIELPHTVPRTGHRVYFTTGFDREEIVDLCVLINSVGREPDATKWPPCLGLFKSVVATLTYMRHNRTQAEIGESFGVSQPTISRAVSAITPLIPEATREFVPTADDLDPEAQYVLDGTLLPCWSWDGHDELYSGKHKTTGMNVQVACTIYGKLAWISDPVNGSRHDNYCQKESGVLLTMNPKNWIGDKGYIGNNMITPYRKPAGGELLDWQKEYNTEVNKIRWMIEQVISHFKNWSVPRTLEVGIRR